MTTLTLDLPEVLTQQLQQRKISEDEIKAVLLATLEIWLSQTTELSGERPVGRFAQSAEAFARRLIAQNRKLFDTLARR
jgi:hypothetical protein